MSNFIISRKFFHIIGIVGIDEVFFDKRVAVELWLENQSFKNASQLNNLAWVNNCVERGRRGAKPDIHTARMKLKSNIYYRSYNTTGRYSLEPIKNSCTFRTWRAILRCHASPNPIMNSSFINAPVIESWRALRDLWLPFNLAVTLRDFQCVCKKLSMSHI